MANPTAEDFQALREVEEAWLAAELGRAIANLAYPVGCGSAPHDYHLKAAAKALFDRYARMIEMARGCSHPSTERARGASSSDGSSHDPAAFPQQESKAP